VVVKTFYFIFVVIIIFLFNFFSESKTKVFPARYLAELQMHQGLG